MLPLWPFLFGGRAGDFSRGFIFEGSPRTSRRHERAGGRWSSWDFAREREEDDDVFDDDDGLGLTTSLGSYGLRYAVVRLDSTLTASQRYIYI